MWTGKPFNKPLAQNLIKSCCCVTIWCGKRRRRKKKHHHCDSSFFPHHDRLYEVVNVSQFQRNHCTTWLITSFIVSWWSHCITHPSSIYMWLHSYAQTWCRFTESTVRMVESTSFVHTNMWPNICADLSDSDRFVVCSCASAQIHFFPVCGNCVRLHTHAIACVSQNSRSR